MNTQTEREKFECKYAEIFPNTMQITYNKFALDDNGDYHDPCVFGAYAMFCAMQCEPVAWMVGDQIFRFETTARFDSEHCGKPITALYKLSAAPASEWNAAIEAAAAKCEELRATISEPFIIGQEAHDAGHNTLKNLARVIANLKRPAAQQVVQDKDADMFWDDDDSELCGQSIHEIIDREYSDGSVHIGDVMTIQRAIRLPNIDVQIVAAKDEADDWDYEIIEGSKQS